MEEEGGIYDLVVQMDNLRGLIGIRRMDRIPYARIREFCGSDEGLVV